mgnify:CR=1 FL=1|jgi:hypothetical protein|tara:strand:+ start:63 stop:467 length:405 start_codon:yes stop_codon:yes gene_type:complete
MGILDAGKSVISAIGGGGNRTSRPISRILEGLIGGSRAPQGVGQSGSSLESIEGKLDEVIASQGSVGTASSSEAQTAASLAASEAGGNTITTGGFSDTSKITADGIFGGEQQRDQVLNPVVDLDTTGMNSVYNK